MTMTSLLEAMGAKRCLNLNKFIFPSFSHFGNTRSPVGLFVVVFFWGTQKKECSKIQDKKQNMYY